MSAGKWTVRRTGDKLWRFWDGDGYQRGPYLTWEETMRFAHRAALAHAMANAYLAAMREDDE